MFECSQQIITDSWVSTRCAQDVPGVLDDTTSSFKKQRHSFEQNITYPDFLTWLPANPLDAVELKELRKIVGLDPLIDFIELPFGYLDKMLFAILCSKPNHIRLDTGGIVAGSKVAPCASACIPLSRLPSKIGRAIINAGTFLKKMFASRE